MQIDKKSFENHWGFSYEDVADGTVGFSYSDWFESLHKFAKKMTPNQEDGESDKTAVLSYMAAVMGLEDVSPRDLSERTFPQFNVAVLALQKKVEPYSWMLKAIKTREFRSMLASGKSNVDAAKAVQSSFDACLKKSFVPKAAQNSDIEIEW